MREENKLMIKASKNLINYIDSQESVEILADELGVTRQTVYNVKNGADVSSEMIAKILKHTGFDFEKAFETR